jgi:hypothetical protein
MCGESSPILQNHWYVYDNGERFISSVCQKCFDLHKKLVQK